MIHFTKTFYTEWIPTITGFTIGGLCSLMSGAVPVCIAAGSASKAVVKIIMKASFNEPIDFQDIGKEMITEILVGLAFYGIITLVVQGVKHLYIPAKAGIANLLQVTKVCADGQALIPEGGIPFEDLPDALRKPHGLKVPGVYTITPDMYLDYPELLAQNPNGINIQFDSKGYPNFSKYASKTVNIKLTGSRINDVKLANEAVGLTTTPKGYIWHHHQNATTMQLVPEPINKVPHTGGFSTRKFWVNLGKVCTQ